MEQNSTNSAMQNGLIAGALISLNFFLSAFKISVLSSFTFLISIATIVFLYFATKRFRDTINGGVMTYSQAFGYIFRVYIYGSIIGSLVMLIYSFLNPDFLSVMLNDILLVYDKINFPIDDKTYGILNSIFKPAPYALFNLFGSAIIATFWGLILALFLKKEKSIFEE